MKEKFNKIYNGIVLFFVVVALPLEIFISVLSFAFYRGKKLNDNKPASAKYKEKQTKLEKLQAKINKLNGKNEGEK